MDIPVSLLLSFLESERIVFWDLPASLPVLVLAPAHVRDACMQHPALPGADQQAAGGRPVPAIPRSGSHPWQACATELWGQ
jgi:hypothetical protein